MPHDHGPDTYWLDLLRQQVKQRGQAAVASDLACSRATISLLLRGRYPAATSRMERRVLERYGSQRVQCQVLGSIDCEVCNLNHRLACELGLRCGNPDTLRLRKACLHCDQGTAQKRRS